MISYRKPIYKRVITFIGNIGCIGPWQKSVFSQRSCFWMIFDQFVQFIEASNLRVSLVHAEFTGNLKYV